MSWGVKTIGFANVLDELEDLTIEIGTDAVHVVGSNVTYAVHQEFGTSKMPGQPYLRPAARHTRRNLGAIASKAESGDDLIRLVALDVERRAKELVAVDTGHLRSSIKSERVN